MSSLGNAALQTYENAENKRMPCPLYGCRRGYTDAGALESHLRDHETPAESLPGKLLLCSSAGCGGSFTNMQKLMEHMRHHHKPNIYFQCESCRTKLRTYRNLLGHLHTCSKVPRGKSKTAELAAPPSSAGSSFSVASKAMEQLPPRLETVPVPQPVPFQVANPDGSVPAAKPQHSSAGPPVLGSPIVPFPETSPSKLTLLKLSGKPPQPPVRNEAAHQPPSLNFTTPKVVPNPAGVQSQLQTQSRSPEGIHSASGSAAPFPPGSAAVWKKNQGLACSRRVLWEHTRGRYTCVQCGHIVTNRKEMTQHISSKHSGNKAAEGTEASAADS